MCLEGNILFHWESGWAFFLRSKSTMTTLIPGEKINIKIASILNMVWYYSGD